MNNIIERKNKIGFRFSALVISSAVMIGAFIAIGAVLVSHKASFAAGTNDVCTVSPILVNSCRPLLGAYVTGYPNVPNGLIGQIENHESRIGQQLDIEHTTYKTGASVLSAAEIQLADTTGANIFVNYKPITGANAWSESAGVANGGEASVDANITNLANSIKSVAPNKVMLSIWHEPENDVSPGTVPTTMDNPGTTTPACPNGVGLKGTAGSPAQYVAMWQNVENIFAQQGVTNVVWAMSYMSYQPFNCLTSLLYPGNNLVNWVLYDTYDQGTPNTPWQSTAGAFYNHLLAESNATTNFDSKPWGIGEWGSCLPNGTQNGINQYYTDATNSLNANLYPRLKMYSIFDAPGSGNTPPGGCMLDYTFGGTLDPTTQADYNNFADDTLLTDAYYNQADTTPPTVPTNLTATLVGNNQVNLNWSASTDNISVAGYNIYRNGTLLTSVPNYLGTSYTDNSITSGSSYTYTVTAYDNAGNESVQSVSSSVSGQDTTAPTTPTNLTATSVGGSQVNLSWSASTDNVGVTGYDVYRNGVLLTTVTSGTTYNDTGVTDAMSYTYSVAAFDAAGNMSAQSLAANVTTLDNQPPTVPSSLSATPVSGTQVNLSWSASTDNVGVAGYDVFRNGNLLTTVTSGTTYSDTGLANASSYSYAVAAYDAAGNMSAPSNTASATTPDTQPPTVPTNLTATAVGGTQVNLSWAASSDNVAVAGYNVYRNGVLLSVVASGTSYTDTQAVNATSYSYTIAAFDGSGNLSAQSLPANATTADTQPPSVPTNLTAVSISGTQVNLNWSASTDNVGVAGYNVYRNGNLLTTVTNGTSFSDSGLTNATLYTYSVSAFDAAGNTSALSNSSPTTTPDTQPPTTPTGLSTTNVGSTQVSFSWTASTDNVAVTGYDVYRNGALIGTSTSTSYTDAGTSSATAYVYNVAAFDGAGNISSESSPLNVTTNALIPPTTPTGLNASPVNGNQINLSWTASTDSDGTIAGYDVYRNGVLVGNTTALAYSDNGLTDATLYSYTVAAFDTLGNISPQSTAVSATTPDNQPPTVPTGLSAAVISGTQINLSWNASTDNVGVTGYDVYRNGILISTTSATNFSNAGLTQATLYSFSIAAFDAAGNISAQTSTVIVTTPDTQPPSVPSGVIASAVSGTQVNISWNASTDNVGVAGYDVYRNGSLVANVTGVTSYSDKSLNNGTTYSYNIAAFDAAGNISAQTSTVIVTTPDTQPPSVPSGVIASAVSGTQVNISWNASTDNVGVAGYDVYRNGTLLGTTTSTSYSNAGLTENTSYSYSIAAYDATKNTSAQTSTVSVTTLDTQAPTTPASLKATASGGTQVNLTWTASTDNVGVKGYKIYRNSVLVATTTTTTTSYSDTGLTDATTYKYTVAAYDAAGNLSAQSASSSATTADTQAPTVPSGLKLTLAAKSINLGWTASTDNVGVGGYKIYRNGVLLASTSSLTYSDTTVVQGTTYKYNVAAYDAAGNLSAQSTSQSLLFPDTTAPTKPTNLSLTPSTTSVALKWTASTDNVAVTGYQIYQGTTLVATVAGNVTSYTRTGLKANTSYSFHIVATDAAGNLSTASTTVTTKTT